MILLLLTLLSSDFIYTILTTGIKKNINQFSSEQSNKNEFEFIIYNIAKSAKIAKNIIKIIIIYYNLQKYINMDLDSRAYSKLLGVDYSDVNFKKYRRIL